MKKLTEMIQEMLRVGVEMDCVQIAKTVDLVNEQQDESIKISASRNQKLIYVRNTVNAAIRAAGFKVLNTRKNAYKPVTTYEDHLKYRSKIEKRMYRYINEFKRINEEMSSRGFPIQVEYSPEMEELERGTKAAEGKSKQAL